MLVSHSKKFIFIHNYKVAGTSIRNALAKYRLSPTQRFQQKLGLRAKNHHKTSDNHLTAIQIREKLGTKLFDRYFTFGFVRDPWDWQVSLYRYALKNTKHKQHALVTGMNGFEEYLHWRIEKDFQLQKTFFYDETGKCIVNFVGKYEQLSSDFAHICQQIKIKEHLTHLNQSRANRDYLSYYTPETITLVAKVWAADIATFGYSVPVV